jgi:7-methyl-GTP pyrophosphatase
LHQRPVPRIILASTSAYRRRLLGRFEIPFDQLDPGFDESDRPGESPPETASRLALGKADSVVRNMKSDSPFIVIGSDQVVHLDEKIFAKPGSHQSAAMQLRSCSGNWVSFTTAICLIDETGCTRQASECYRIRYRQLQSREIDAYLNIDRPFDCAGSIKAESTGITLFDDSRGRDISTLYGLPLMLLQDTLAAFGWPLLTLRSSRI